MSSPWGIRRRGVYTLMVFTNISVRCEIISYNLYFLYEEVSKFVIKTLRLSILSTAVNKTARLELFSSISAESNPILD